VSVFFHSFCSFQVMTTAVWRSLPLDSYQVCAGWVNKGLCWVPLHHDLCASGWGIVRLALPPPHTHPPTQ
jgi:hypothetical protein